MIAIKSVFVLANYLGWCIFFGGIWEAMLAGDAWKKNVLFFLSLIFVIIKITDAVLNLIKKKLMLMRKGNYQEIVVKI